MRIAAAVLLMFVLASAQSQPPQPETPRTATPDWKTVHNSALVVDTHADTPMRFYYEGYDIAGPRGLGHMDLQAMKDGNLGAQFFSIFLLPRETPPSKYAETADEIIDAVEQQVRKHPDALEFAYGTADITRIRSAGKPKFAVLMGMEGGHMIENSLDKLRHFYRRGVRYMTLTWANTNEWADSSGDLKDPKIKHHGGLTTFGREVVREMNRLGMMVDVSHVSDETFWDTTKVTKAPVIASHSSARALTNHARNMNDDMLRAVAKNGGVVQVNFASFFIDENFRRAYAAQSKERNAAISAIDARNAKADRRTRFVEHVKAEIGWASKIPQPPLKSLIDHIDHIAKVAGVDHVGLGSDFDGIDAWPEDMNSAADLPKITQALMERGYSAEDVRKILGGNIMRVFADVERVAQRLQANSPSTTAAGDHL